MLHIIIVKYNFNTELSFIFIYIYYRYRCIVYPTKNLEQISCDSGWRVYVPLPTFIFWPEIISIIDINFFTLPWYYTKIYLLNLHRKFVITPGIRLISYWLVFGYNCQLYKNYRELHNLFYVLDKLYFKFIIIGDYTLNILNYNILFQIPFIVK